MASDKPSGGNPEIVIMGTFFFAILLSMLNYQESIQSMIPNWVLLIVIYWCLVAPDRFSMFTAWCVGLLLDILNLTILGQHALSFAVAALIVSMVTPRALNYPLWLQCFFVMALCLFVMGFEFWLNHLAFGYEFSMLNWQAVIVAGLIWPFLRVILVKAWIHPDSRND